MQYAGSTRIKQKKKELHAILFLIFFSSTLFALLGCSMAVVSDGLKHISFIS